MAGKMLRIRKWSETFENASTRKLICLQWFNSPSGIDSAGYLSLMTHGADGVLAFGVFQAICQWSATCRPTIRGSLARSDGKPLSTRQLALILRMPEKTVSMALELLSSDEVGWIETGEAENPSVFDESPSDPPTIPQQSASDPPVVSVQGREGKGREGRERNNDNDVVIPKKLDTEQAHAAAEKWFEYLLSKGLYDKIPPSGSPQEESFWQDASRRFESPEEFCDSVDHTMANGWKTLTKRKTSAKSKSSNGTLPEDLLKICTTCKKYPADIAKRREILGPKLHEISKRLDIETILASIGDAWKMKSLNQFYEQHLKDIEST